MQAVYSYRIHADGVTHLEPCANLRDALNRAAYDLAEQGDIVEPVFIALGPCIFTGEQIPVLVSVANLVPHEQALPTLAF